MKFSELDPRFLILETGGPKVGVTFECPHCRDQRLAILFHHSGNEAIEDSYIMARAPSTNHIWAMTGDSFDAMSFSPSIDASSSGHWHGFITNGQVT